MPVKHSSNSLPTSASRKSSNDLLPTSAVSIPKRPNGNSALAIAGLTTGLLFSIVNIANAAPGDDAESSASTNLPVDRVVLFKSGVGYFQHKGNVANDSQIAIPFRVEQINDVLKSLVVSDPQGAIREVRYPSQDPLERSLAGFAIDLSEATDLPSILRQLRGAELAVKTPDTITGRLVSVKTKTIERDESIIEETYITLATDDGLQRLKLSDVSAIKLRDKTLDNELQQALLLLADNQTSDNKTVTLRFGGQGQRDVSLGYIIEAPVWKTSWRLDLSDSKTENQNTDGATTNDTTSTVSTTSRLQGWAMVENTSDSDWNNVELALVSGQPVSFTMDLYTPLYATRPEVAVPRPAQVKPRTYDGAMKEMMPTATFGNTNRGGSNIRLDEYAFADRAYAPAPAQTMRSESKRKNQALGGINTSNVQPSQVGELFQYELDQAVSLPRRTSAMLPIIDSPIQAEKVAIYNRNDNAKHPMNGVLFKNTSGAKLMAGPVTVFDNGYAGDAQIGHIAQDATRLLAYALNIEILADSKQESEQAIVKGVVRDGMLQIERRVEYRNLYTFSNEGGKDKTIIIEHPKRTNAKLLKPQKAFEVTDNALRFKLNVPKAKSAELMVKEYEITDQSFSLLNTSNNNILYYVRNGEISDNVKKVLREVAERRTDIADLETKRNRLRNDIESIKNGQARLRENIKSVGQSSSLGRRYIEKLSNEEDKIEALSKDVNQLTKAIKEAQNDLDAYIKQLEVIT